MSCKWISVKKILKQSPIEASAPCRIDSGGTWDIKAMSLPLERCCPVTVNIALNLRTIVKLGPYKDKRVRIVSSGFTSGEEYSINDLPFDGPFGIFLGAVQYFGLHGLEISITSNSPVKSALGGSSTALVALIEALSRLSSMATEKPALSKKDILHLGYHLEDGISGGNCGIQDQAAAVYGGVNLWKWQYGKRPDVFKREQLLDTKGCREISRHIIAAYSGQSHVSARTNRLWLKDFLSGKSRSEWLEANDIVKEFAEALKKKDWKNAAVFLREELKIRSRITPDALIPVTSKMLKIAEETGCGARFAGAGAGGSVWAIGEEDRINRLKTDWKNLLVSIKTASVLECATDLKGVR